MTYIKKKQTTYRGDDLQGVRVAAHHPRVVHEVGIADGLLLPAARTTPAVTEADPGGGGLRDAKKPRLPAGRGRAARWHSLRGGLGRRPVLVAGGQGAGRAAVAVGDGGRGRSPPARGGQHGGQPSASSLAPTQPSPRQRPRAAPSGLRAEGGPRKWLKCRGFRAGFWQCGAEAPGGAVGPLSVGELLRGWEVAI